jgi:hypothetical protein
LVFGCGKFSLFLHDIFQTQIFRKNTNMEQEKFLEQHIFIGLKNVNDGFGKDGIQFFSETDFEIVLQRAEHFGLSIYSIEPWIDNKFQEVIVHEDHKKKATDPRWYKKEFLTLKTSQAGLFYSARYKVSKKLLAR